MAREIVEKDLEKVVLLLKKVLGAEGYQQIERMGGLTNHTYRVTLEDGAEYVVRIPGEGTEEMIVRNDEKISTLLACRLGVDAKMFFFGEDGTKVTEYLPNAITMSAETLGEERHIEQVAEILKKLHNCGEDTGVPFEVFDMAGNYEKIISDMNIPMFEDYLEKKQQVMDIKSEVDMFAKIRKVPCHNDPLCENWVESDGRMYLIDWEYAGMNDGMWDVADVAIEAGFHEEQEEMLLLKYLGRTPEIADKKHYLANKIYVDYLWTLWAKARVPFDGQSMEDWAQERYARMKAAIQSFTTIKGE